MKPSRVHSLLVRLLCAYLLPTLFLLAVFGVLAYRITARSLEESLGRRLTGIAQATAIQIRAEAIRFLSVGDDDSLTAQRLVHKLRSIKQRTRVARIFILDAELRARADTQESVRIGDRHYQAEADRHEIKRVFQKQEASSVLFVGHDGVTYKTGYAPLFEGDNVIAVLGVQASAEFFTVLARLRNHLVIWGAGVALLIALVSLLLSRRIIRPLRSLASEAARIGSGDLSHSISVESKDEVGLLAATMNEMREGLAQRDQQMQMMLSGIAHEVRNPLGGIELFSGLLREELQGEPQRIQHLQRIEREVQYLKKVVGDFLEYARRVPPVFVTIDLGALLAEVSELMTKDASEKQIEILLENSQNARTRGDVDQLRRVLINLLHNSLAATPPDGRVTLRCGRDEKWAFFEVEDTGNGIDPEILPKIFTPFFTTREKGTGLGLAFAKKAMEEHAGELSVRSILGHGTIFRGTLPLGEGDGDHSDH